MGSNENKMTKGREEIKGQKLMSSDDALFENIQMKRMDIYSFKSEMQMDIQSPNVNLTPSSFIRCTQIKARKLSR